MADNLPEVHVMLRYINRENRTNEAMNVWSGAEVDAQVSAWIGKGYKLQNTHYIGENPEGFGLVFILIKEA